MHGYDDWKTTPDDDDIGDPPPGYFELDLGARGRADDQRRAVNASAGVLADEDIDF